MPLMCPQPGIALIRRLIQKRTTRQSAPRVGSATKCISPKRVMTTVRTCLPMSKLRPRLWPMMRRFRSCTKHSQQRDLLPGVHLVDTGYVDAAGVGQQSAAVWRRSLRSDSPRLSLASAGRDRLRRFPVRRGLAERVCHLSGGTDQQQLDTRPGSAWQPSDQNQIRDAGLSSLP